MQGVVAGSPGSTPTYWGIEGNGTNGLIRTVSPVGVEDGIEYFEVRYAGTATASGTHQIGFDSTTSAAASTGETWAATVFIASIGDTVGVINPRLQISERTAAGAQIAVGEVFVTLAPNRLSKSRIELVHTIGMPDVGRVSHKFIFSYANGTAVDITLRIGLPQLERDRVTSPIKTSNGAVTRAADVIGSTAGLIYSNVPMVEPPYDAAVTYAKDTLVRDPVTHGVYQSLIDANKGKPLTDEASWNSRGKTNRWAMLDEYNNTQTTNPEEIVIVLSPQSICEGIFLGNTDADEIELVVVDQSEGKVYSEVTSLVTASGSSSYYDWCFRPADRADYYFTVAMPPYASALVTVVLRKPGGVAKCGMAVIGLVDDFGPSLYGLSASGKDFSSTTFNFDGTSKTQYRDYAKQMNVDVQVNNGEIDYIQRKLFQLRQRPIVWIGGPYGATAVFGRYVSFDIVIPGLLKSDMSLQIEGSV